MWFNCYTLLGWKSINKNNLHNNKEDEVIQGIGTVLSYDASRKIGYFLQHTIDIVRYD